MKTTVDIPKDLLEKAQDVIGAKTKTTTIILGLQKLVESSKMERLIKLQGKLHLDIDADKLRERRKKS